ncbi:hypothetical protein MCUN1_000266 [Malassezia cuniculi]|uniref:Uncharacterized protein n=1 Tax=Malassezia cuniculi TaxID=948313 RepID=A0AAF0EMV4_9BASI|nr:hypothetical protein MCUN1_000266 [Malassezia cuniculi]
MVYWDDFSVIPHSVAAYVPNVVRMVTMGFRLIAAATTLPVLIFFMIELAGYTVILFTGARYRQRKLVEMVAESTEALSETVSNATGLNDTKKSSAAKNISNDKVAAPSAAASTGTPAVNTITGELRQRITT